MTRKIFISFDADDKKQVDGCRLLRWNKYIQTDFIDRSMVTPVKSNDPNYIASKIKELIKGSSVTVCLIGWNTHKSEWVDWEVRTSHGMGKGLLGIRLKDTQCRIPKCLIELGVKVIDWAPYNFEAKIEEAATSVGA